MASYGFRLAIAPICGERKVEWILIACRIVPLYRNGFIISLLHLSFNALLEPADWLEEDVFM